MATYTDDFAGTGALAANLERRTLGVIERDSGVAVAVSGTNGDYPGAQYAVVDPVIGADQYVQAVIGGDGTFAPLHVRMSGVDIVDSLVNSYLLVSEAVNNLKIRKGAAGDYYAAGLIAINDAVADGVAMARLVSACSAPGVRGTTSRAATSAAVRQSRH